MDGREFRDLLAHMEWADARTWQSARVVPAALTDDRLKWLFHHIHLVHSVYLQAWRGDPFVVTDLKDYADLNAIEVWARPFYAKAVAFAGAIDASRYSQPLEFPWNDLIVKEFGTVRPATLSESAWQVFSHTTYHRGQIATRVREIGGVPPTVDYLAWVWGGRPAPKWIAD
jgi:uncharacterized damage-inducible protein DinB